MKVENAILYLVAACACLLTACSVSANERPNILFIITDDQERREFNFLPEGRDGQGRPKNLSPNIDRLAAEGVVLLNQYVSSPVCTPSRYFALTGTYASRSTSFGKAASREQQVNITWSNRNLLLWAVCQESRRGVELEEIASSEGRWLAGIWFHVRLLLRDGWIPEELASAFRADERRASSRLRRREAIDNDVFDPVAVVT